MINAVSEGSGGVEPSSSATAAVLNRDPKPAWLSRRDWAWPHGLRLSVYHPGHDSTVRPRVDSDGERE